MNPNQDNKGVFINGKNQVVELLRSLDSGHREKLLKNIGIRNPKLAEELIQESVTFDELDSLNNQKLKILLESFKPALVGIALKPCSIEFQKRALSVLKRENAIEAFDSMNSTIQNQMANIKNCLLYTSPSPRDRG